MIIHTQTDRSDAQEHPHECDIVYLGMYVSEYVINASVVWNEYVICSLFYKII